MEITDLLKCPVRYEDGDIVQRDDILFHIYVAKIYECNDLQYLFENEYQAIEYQTKLGNFIADAINEKLKSKTTGLVEHIQEHRTPLNVIKTKELKMACCDRTFYNFYNYCPICGAKIVRDK